MNREIGLPHCTDYHRTPLKLLNKVLRTLRLTTGFGKSYLNEASLIQAARKATGLHFLEDESFRINMRTLLKSIEEEAYLNPTGRIMVRELCVKLLKDRLWAEDLFDRHPEILERDIAPPVVVVGLARSGTTRLHRMLASDSRFLHLKLWEANYPVPWPNSFNSKIDPRIAYAERALKIVKYMNKEMFVVHPTGLMEPEEENLLLRHSFCSVQFEIWFKIPTFGAWILHNDQTDAYKYMVKLIKLISWFRGDNSDQPWILKSPQHMQHLDALMRVFPDARILFIHRDPIKTVASSCSLAWNVLVSGTDTIEPFWIGQEWLNKIDAVLKKAFEIRDSIIPLEQQLDILYADMNTDWKSVMRRIYTFIGMDFSAEVEQSMKDWLAGQHKHTGHRYKLEDFGLNPKEVDERLMYYRNRFAIPYEGRRPE